MERRGGSEGSVLGSRNDECGALLKPHSPPPLLPLLWLHVAKPPSSPDDDVFASAECGELLKPHSPLLLLRLLLLLPLPLPLPL